MIDPHVHLRDWEQAYKETLRHGLWVAMSAGLDGVFEMPNTSPPILTKKAAENRLRLADSVNPGIFHGLYMGLTAHPEQVKEAVRAYYSLYPRVVGLKLYTSGVRGSLKIADPADIRGVMQTLTMCGYRGVLALHCEHEPMLKPMLWDSRLPQSHGQARPPEAETESVKINLKMAAEAGFRGRLHICHVSTPDTVRLIRTQGYGLNVGCGVTPHHLLLNEDLKKGKNGILYKVNPPLRAEATRMALFETLLEGKISWIESDHAPHTLEEKLDGYGGEHPSGFPVLPFYPYLLEFLRMKGLSESLITSLTHTNIEEVFGFRISSKTRAAEFCLAEEYEFDPFLPFKKGILNYTNKSP